MHLNITRRNILISALNVMLDFLPGSIEVFISRSVTIVQTRLNLNAKGTSAYQIILLLLQLLFFFNDYYI